MELLAFSKEDKIEIWKKYEVDEDKITRDVQIIEEWLTKQPHLPQTLPFDNFIEKVLLNSKFRVEVAKEKIDGFFTMKNWSKAYFDLFAGPQYILPSQNTTTFLPLPKLGILKERILLLGLRKADDLYEFHHYIQISLATMELGMKYDYCDGIRLVGDLGNYGLTHVKKLDLIAFAKLNAMIGGGNCFRIVGADFINFKPYQNVVINAAKATLKTKVAERFMTHDSLESLHRRVPKECLPEEYGGTLGKLANLVDKMDRLVGDNRQYLIDCPKYASDESLRTGQPKCMTDMYGVDGTFRKLNVD